MDDANQFEAPYLDHWIVKTEEFWHVRDEPDGKDLFVSSSIVDCIAAADLLSETLNG